MTNIEWTDKVWNPIRGCSRVSPGCQRCYAERQAIRHAGKGGHYEGLVDSGVLGTPRWTGEIRLVPEKLDEPLRWKKPRRVFVNSMSDLFHEKVPDEFIDRVWATMLLAPRHTFQILTKRPERMRSYLTASDLYDRVLRAAQPIRVQRPELMGVGISNPATHPRPWVWLGVSVEAAAQRRRLTDLLATPAAVHFASFEPLLSHVDARPWLGLACVGCGGGIPGDMADTTTTIDETLPCGCRYCIVCTSRRRHVDHDEACGGPPRLRWAIVGGESGPGARPCDVAWIRSLVEQCRAARVAIFCKQLGARPITDSLQRQRDDGRGWGDHVEFEKPPGLRPDQVRAVLASRKGGDPSEWPRDLRVREWPATT